MRKLLIVALSLGLFGSVSVAGQPIKSTFNPLDTTTTTIAAGNIDIHKIVASNSTNQLVTVVVANSTDTTGSADSDIIYQIVVGSDSTVDIDFNPPIRSTVVTKASATAVVYLTTVYTNALGR